ncbi:Secoisolariciresinol dehydrogenase [Melia azedarach]|uniref:Secoisolariciresinol dehydrogenase n=1 Tax=Melia azedarach TaxID=155640 RepID=A0ACC1X248_MELAZ|nr:Secoisolariciresinol dehydrogenase [Melia azedarach]
MTTSSSSVAPIPAKRLEDKVAIITGGASGFGESTARLFLQHGAKVIIADVQDDRGQALCKGFNSDEDISYVHCDVSNDSDVKNVVDFAISKVMIPAKKGVILFTASVASLIGGVTSIAYAMSKHAVVGIMKDLCVELGQYGIRVNCISPSWIATPMLLNGLKMDKKTVEEQLICSSATLKGVVPTAEDVAEASLFLSSDESKYVSGLNLVVDGGYTTTNGSFTTVLKSFS